MSKLSTSFHKLFNRVVVLADQDKDGDFDKQDMIIIAKKLLARYLDPEQVDQITSIAKQQVVLQKGLRDIQNDGAMTDNQAHPSSNYYDNASRDQVVDLIIAAIDRLFGVKIPRRVINFLVETIVNLIAMLQENEVQPVEPVGSPV